VARDVHGLFGMSLSIPKSLVVIAIIVLSGCRSSCRASTASGISTPELSACVAAPASSSPVTTTTALRVG
jgi:hypothetical protein